MLSSIALIEQPLGSVFDLVCISDGEIRDRKRSHVKSASFSLESDPFAFEMAAADSSEQSCSSNSSGTMVSPVNVSVLVSIFPCHCGRAFNGDIDIGDVSKCTKIK